MGREKVREIRLDYLPNEIDEHEEIWDRLDDLRKAGIIRNWEITGDREEITDEQV